VLLFADLSKYRIRAEVDEQYVHQVKPGQKATVYGRNLGDRTYHGDVVFVKQLMGNKTVFARSATERKDLEAVQVLSHMEPSFSATGGLRVDVAIEAPAPKAEGRHGE
jgi:HlyD family secretion protein